MTPIGRVRDLLDEQGIEHDDPTNTCTDVIVGNVLYRFYEYDDQSYEMLRGRVFVSTNWLTPEQAIAATVGDKPKDNPRNYNPDGTPKIPNMHIGADPDWVDWVASLEHKEPLGLTEAVKQLMFEVICFGGDMGPNDCGGEHCPDEGMVYTNDFINGWVNKIAATVGEEHEMHICKRCGVAYELNIFDKGFGKSRFCPNCGHREVYQ